MQGGRTSEKEILEDLFEADVLEEEDDGVVPHPAFREAREESLSRLDGLQRDAWADELSDHVVEEGIDLESTDRGVVATAMALERSDFDPTDLDALGIARALDRHVDPLPNEGVPDGFTPIEGSEIGEFLQQFPASIVYCWRHDCEPCDLVKEDLNELSSNGRVPESIGLGAVYVPDCTELLREQYMVGVAPTLLFCVVDEVDSRLIGAHEPDAVHAEIRMIAKRSGIEA